MTGDVYVVTELSNEYAGSLLPSLKIVVENELGTFWEFSKEMKLYVWKPEGDNYFLVEIKNGLYPSA
jgi:hypothetical protein